MTHLGASDTSHVALETTLLAHGVPRGAAMTLADEVDRIITSHGAIPITIGVHEGEPIIGMTRDQLRVFLAAPRIEKANTSNLGALMHQRKTAATTVSATVELAAGAGIRLMATGGIGGVHGGPSFDVSADLAALSRFPVAVVCSGCKAILDVQATRKALETLGVPVVGWRTDRLPAFYLRDGGCEVDARFDAIDDLARFITKELTRTGRGMVIANPIPESDALSAAAWRQWLAEAQQRAANEAASGRDATPRLLAALHDVSGGATLRANIALVKANAALAAQLAAAMARN